MKAQTSSLDNLIYETLELKLGALLLAELPEVSVEIYQAPSSIRKTIKIVYPAKYRDSLSKLECDFINKRAMVNVYAYNRSLNLIRNKLRGENGQRTY